ncbi:hypothetical protein ILUMI_10137 [Ignelater luminosus]|uniref:Serpin domain-containing protein n=1 Tax=Ignelater luminosus TaxID=2038154 RepID=A0A8K0D106_IGNLU|nr:hypothetical protein ILUMI_10137 [Ignelater luminosus]
MKLLFVCGFLIGIFKVPFIASEPPRWRAGHTYPQPLPQDIMVDAVNYIGLIILHAHNQNNENNIAFSPYGATSVLVALGEGVQGIALDEILRATLLPLDVSITRVGLRDIHRHLKSYFIPQEGFLAGLTFSHENVTLKSSYEDILRFYGYDVNSFNNALYPDPNTVTTSSTSSTTPTSPANTTSTTTPTTSLVTVTEDRDESMSTSTLVPESTVTTTSNTETTHVETITTTPLTTTTVISSAPTTRPISTTTATPITTQTEPPDATSTIVTSTQTTTTSTAQPTTTESATSSTAITIDTTITTSPDSTTTSTTVSPTMVVTETVTTSIPLSTRPTAVTIDIVPSTVGNADTTSTSSSTIETTVTQLDSMGPIIINLQPTTLSSTTVESTTIINDSTPTSTTLLSTTSTETTDTDSTATDSTIMSTIENTAITIDVTPTTRGSQNSEGTTTITTMDSTITSITGDTPIIVSVMPTTRTPQDDESTATTDTTLMSTTENAAITVDVMPTTRNSQNIGNTATNENMTERPIPTIITPSGSDLPTGFEVIVQPTTLGPRTENIKDGNETNRMTSRKPRTKSLPRFRDDVELVNMLKSENKTAQTQNSSKTNRAVISANTKVTSIENKTEVLRSSFMLSKTDGFNEPKNISTEVNDLLSSAVIKETSTATELTDATDDTVVKELDSIEASSDDDRLVSSSSEEESFTGTEKSSDATENIKPRGTRSVIDYLIARYHDNNPTRSYMSSATGYEPARPTTFAVNGKIREPNINFMTYDTVLPFRYISHLNALALTFPLDSTRYYLLLVLPIDEMGIDNLVSNMMSTTLKQIIYSLQPTRVKATIPSFMLKGYIVLTPTLQKLGIRQIFEPRRADFSRMTNDKDIYVTNIEQAVTVTIRNYVDPNTLQNDNHNFRRRGPVQFMADHPFLYFVMDSQIHVALMAGKIINPLNSRIR